jgi:cell division protein FtsI/penicillin-binding protein 2
MKDFKDYSTRRKGFWPKRNRKPRNLLRKPVALRDASPSRVRRLRIILPLIAVLLVVYPVASYLLAGAKSTIRGIDRKNAISASSPAKASLEGNGTFALAAGLLDRSREDNEKVVAPLPDGGTVVYALDEDLQERIVRLLDQFKVPYGAFVAVEPKTGRVLALVGRSAVDHAWDKRGPLEVYPMASLFKIVTASAALEQKKVSSDTVVAFRGRLTSENPKYWEVGPRQRGQEMSLTTAMGKSVNPVFGNLASDVVGRDSIMACAEQFGFNQDLFPGSGIAPSRAATPQDDHDLMLMGAGLGREVKISPVHAAALMGAVANGGIMMTPSLVQEIRNARGEVVYAHTDRPLRRLMSPETAGQLARMLSTTVKSGTSRKVVHDRRGRPKLSSVSVAAKTGSIDGKNPDGHYSWFAAYAPMEDPQIAVVALVVNQPKWKIKASYVGEQALEEFFE